VHRTSLHGCVRCWHSVQPCSDWRERSLRARRLLRSQLAYDGVLVNAWEAHEAPLGVAQRLSFAIQHRVGNQNVPMSTRPARGRRFQSRSVDGVQRIDVHSWHELCFELRRRLIFQGNEKYAIEMPSGASGSRGRSSLARSGYEYRVGKDPLSSGEN